MAEQDNDLPFGLYERLITASLKARLLEFGRDRTRIQTNPLDPAEAHITLARYIEGKGERPMPADFFRAAKVASA